MHLKKLIFFISVISLPFILTLPKVNQQIKIRGIDCRSVRSTEDVSCKVRAVNRSLSMASLNFTIRIPLNNISVNIQLFKKNSVDYKPFLANVTANFCELLAGVKGSFYADFAFNFIKRYSNFGKPCPILGQYYIKDLYVPDNIFPVLLMSGSYRVNFKTWNNEYLGYATAWTDISSKQYD